MLEYLNVTKHPITLQFPDTEPFSVEPCGVVIDAAPVSEPAWPRSYFSQVCGGYAEVLAPVYANDDERTARRFCDRCGKEPAAFVYHHARGGKMTSATLCRDHLLLDGAPDLVRTVFKADEANLKALDRLEALARCGVCGAIEPVDRLAFDTACQTCAEGCYDEPARPLIVGSIIAAQAYPGRVFAMVPMPGFERVPPDQKRMRADRFVTFA